MCKPYVLGIDIGGTNTVFGMVDARGEVLASSSIKTKKHSDFNDYLNDLHSEVTRMLTDNDAEDKILGFKQRVSVEISVSVNMTHPVSDLRREV